MQFVDSYIFQCVRSIVLPQTGILRTNQQVIQHLIVRHQDIRGCIQKCIVIRNDIIFRHHTARSMFMSAHIHTGSDISLKFRTLIDKIRNTPCLISSKRVHWVDDQRLYTLLSSMLIAVLQDRIQETLGLTGTCSGSDQCRSSIVSRQSVKSHILMNIWKVCRMYSLKAIRHILCHPERKTHGYIGLMID